MTDAPPPSKRARELLRGAYDTHIHVAPDVVPRIVDDVTLAQRFAELGMDGFVLKSHYTSTAERASVVRAAVPGIQALGAIVLNRAVGGMNALRTPAFAISANASSGSNLSALRATTGTP